MDDIIKLDSMEWTNNELGGKVNGLIRLHSLGFEIPLGFVVSPSLQKTFFERNGINTLLSEEVKLLKSDNYMLSSEASKRMRVAIISSNFSNREHELIKNTTKTIIGQTGADVFAIRSSCSLEDSENNSWAGQFDSFLNISEDNIAEYIKHCWASLFGTRPIHYDPNLFDAGIPSFSIIVQQMIHGEYSGVAFSTDPIDGNPNHIRIESIEGTGEKIVGGQEIPYTTIIDKEEGLILRRTFSDSKKIELVPPSHLKALSNQIKRIESEFNLPVDVEWAIKEEKVFILQARPITIESILTTKKENSLPDILDYELTFKVHGLNFLFADLLAQGFGYLDPLFICSENIFFQYFTKNKMEYAAKYGYNWLSTPGGFEKYKNDFTSYHKENSQKMENILTQPLTLDNMSLFFQISYDYFRYYSKMDFQFTNLTYLYANENPVIASSLVGISLFKDEARQWINKNFINEDSLFDKMIELISNFCGLHREIILFYKIDELFKLIDGFTLQEEVLAERKKCSIVYRENNDVKYLYGEKAIDYADHVRKIEDSYDCADIIGQVANRGANQYVEGRARVIKIDYKNIDKMDKEISEMMVGEILVSEFTSPELVVACNKAKAIITDLGGMLSHAAIISRELNIPCIVGTGGASRTIKNGSHIVLNLDLGVVTISD